MITWLDVWSIIVVKNFRATSASLFIYLQQIFLRSRVDEISSAKNTLKVCRAIKSEAAQKGMKSLNKS